MTVRSVHGGVLDRHQPGERAAGDDEAAHVLGQVARKAEQLVNQAHGAQDQGIVRVEPRLPHPLRGHCLAVPPVQIAGQTVHLIEGQSQGLAHVPHRALGPVGDHSGGQGGPLAAVLAVDVLDDLLAALVLEVHVDVRRLARAPWR